MSIVLRGWTGWTEILRPLSWFLAQPGHKDPSPRPWYSGRRWRNHSPAPGYAEANPFAGPSLPCMQGSPVFLSLIYQSRPSKKLQEQTSRVTSGRSCPAHEPAGSQCRSAAALPCPRTCRFSIARSPAHVCTRRWSVVSRANSLASTFYRTKIKVCR